MGVVAYLDDLVMEGMKETQFDNSKFSSDSGLLFKAGNKWMDIIVEDDCWRLKYWDKGVPKFEKLKLRPEVAEVLKELQHKRLTAGYTIEDGSLTLRRISSGDLSVSFSPEYEADRIVGDKEFAYILGIQPKDVVAFKNDKKNKLFFPDEQVTLVQLVRYMHVNNPKDPDLSFRRAGINDTSGTNIRDLIGGFELPEHENKYRKRREYNGGYNPRRFIKRESLRAYPVVGPMIEALRKDYRPFFKGNGITACGLACLTALLHAKGAIKESQALKIFSLIKLEAKSVRGAVAEGGLRKSIGKYFPGGSLDVSCFKEFYSNSRN